MIQSRCLLDADAQKQGIEPLQSLVLRSVHCTSDYLDSIANIYESLCRLEETGFRIIIKGLLDSKNSKDSENSEDSEDSKDSN